LAEEAFKISADGRAQESSPEKKKDKLNTKTQEKRDRALKKLREEPKSSSRLGVRAKEKKKKA